VNNRNINESYEIYPILCTDTDINKEIYTKKGLIIPKIDPNGVWVIRDVE